MVCAVVQVLGKEHDEGAGDHGDAGLGLEHLEGGAQHVAGGCQGAGHHAVGMAGLDHQAPQVERIAGLLAGILDGDALLLAQLGEELGVGFYHGLVGWIHPRGLLYVLKVALTGDDHGVLLLADEDHLGGADTQDVVGGAHRARFRVFGEHQLLRVLLCLCRKTFKKCHGYRVKVLFLFQLQNYKKILTYALFPPAFCEKFIVFREVSWQARWIL